MKKINKFLKMQDILYNPTGPLPLILWLFTILLTFLDSTGLCMCLSAWEKHTSVDWYITFAFISFNERVAKICK